MRRMALIALALAAGAAVAQPAAAQTKVITMPQASPAPPPPQLPEACAAPNPTVIAGGDRQAAQLAEIDHHLAAIAYYLCLIEGDLSAANALKGKAE